MLPFNGMPSDRARARGRALIGVSGRFPDSENGRRKISAWAAERLGRVGSTVLSGRRLLQASYSTVRARRYFDLYPADSIKLPEVRRRSQRLSDGRRRAQADAVHRGSLP